MSQVLFLGSDHGGFALKKSLIARLRESFPSYRLEDLGTDSEQSCDYPDYAKKVAESVRKESQKGTEALGILVCGSGTGVSIAANKVRGIRAANVWNSTSARLAREHNNVQVLCLGERLVTEAVAWDAVCAWLGAKFQGGRHEGRIKKISDLENA